MDLVMAMDMVKAMVMNILAKAVAMAKSICCVINI